MVALRLPTGHRAAGRLCRSHNDDVLSRLAAIGGVVLRFLFGAMLRVRRPRPIHAHGVVLEGELQRIGTPAKSGIRWIDDPSEAPEPVVGRLSRSIGLPSRLPDVIGLALRIQTTVGPADLELSTTGIGVPGRFMLVPRRSPSGATFGTLLPYRAQPGPILVCARDAAARSLPADLGAIAASLRSRPWLLRLYFASPTGKWHPFADLVLRCAADQDDAALRFDAVRRPLPGARSYRWVRLLRQPSYHRVQDIASTGGAVTGRQRAERSSGTGMSATGVPGVRNR
jgi:hypothetical protein